MPDQSAPTIKEQRDLKQQDKERRRQAAARQGRIKTIITWSIVGLVVAGIVALIVVSRGPAGSGTVAAVTDQDHIQGPRTAKATVIEYSDFQCPACAAYYPIMKGLEQKYGDKLALVYRYFPLTQIHQNADLASRAGEAAASQGKFWEMHDLLFERQDSWSTASNAKQMMIDYAQELQLDETKFTKDIDSKEVKDRVNVDVSSGNSAGLSGTPTFFLNGTKLTNPGSADAFSKLIDAQLAGA